MLYFLYVHDFFLHFQGWGKLDDDLPLATTLQKATVPIVSNTNCNSDYNPGGITIDEKSQICAGLGQIDTCAGDSGGPMLSNELSPLKRYAVIGITSSDNVYICNKATRIAQVIIYSIYLNGPLCYV